jgi:hypothetical protein
MSHRSAARRAQWWAAAAARLAGLREATGAPPKLHLVDVFEASVQRERAMPSTTVREYAARALRV